jgi:diguanylate cyclase (GGDEF)-like protein/putative nucleotidyltransferase with HDIG domain
MAVAIYGAHAVYHSPWVRELDGSLLLAVTLSACAFFFLNTISLATRSALSDRLALTNFWQENYLFSLPYYLVGACVGWLITGVTRQISWQAAMLVLAIVFIAYRSYRLYMVLALSRKKHADDMASLQLRTIEALALAIEAKDHTTHDHLRRVQMYALHVGQEMGLSESELEALRAAALLHDIGKLAVPEHIISKPGKLTPEEFEKMKIHPIVGAEILAHMKFPYPVAPIVLSHHERWDGKGYPHGLKGDEIPLGARILGAVDCLDALASDRPHRRAVPIAEAMKRLAAESGKAFDPRVIKILESRYLEIERLIQTRLKAKPRHSHLSPTELISTVESAAQIDNSNTFQFVNLISSARQEGQLLHELSSDLGRTLNVEESLSILAKRLSQLVPYDSLAVYVGSGDRLSPLYVSGTSADALTSGDISRGGGLSGWVAQHQKPILNGNPAVEPGYLTNPNQFATLRSALSVPLPCPRGAVGVLTLYHKQKDAFTRDHLRILLSVSSRVGATIENALQFQQAESTAATDYLTGLPNARSLAEHLDAEIARARREANSLAVILCDLDGFKQVNDRFGHLAGNRILQEVATGLRNSCREYDYIARMGGDEFVLIVPGITADQAAARISQLREIAERSGMSVCGESLLSLSAGVAVFPDDGDVREPLLGEADRRMYENKRARKQATDQTTSDLVRLAPVALRSRLGKERPSESRKT